MNVVHGTIFQNLILFNCITQRNMLGAPMNLWLMSYFPWHLLDHFGLKTNWLMLFYELLHVDWKNNNFDKTEDHNYICKKTLLCFIYQLTTLIIPSGQVDGFIHLIINKINSWPEKCQESPQRYGRWITVKYCMK